MSFTYPYLEDSEYAGLGSKLGFVYGSIAVLAVVAGYLFVPETRDTAIEEIDWQLRAGVPVRKVRRPSAPEDPSATSQRELTNEKL